MVLLRCGQVLTRSSEVTSQRTTNVRFDLYFLRIPNSVLDRRLIFGFQLLFLQSLLPFCPFTEVLLFCTRLQVQ
jgi:hypothetical protein